MPPSTGLSSDGTLRRNQQVASVKERVIDIVAEQLGVNKEQITPETSFVNDLGPIRSTSSNW